MVRTVVRFADRLVARLVPHTEAAAGTIHWRFCYCQYGVAYRGRCWEHSPGHFDCGSCQPAGTC